MAQLDAEALMAGRRKKTILKTTIVLAVLVVLVGAFAIGVAADWRME